jgi:dTDP-4-amino-4,6-dideoxygalactose transaminase
MITNMGEKHHRLTLAMEKVLGVDNLILLSNGHMSLELVLQAMQLKGEVITTPFTFASTTHAIVRNGLTPVFCDIREDDYTIDADKIEELITDKTCAILPVHVYGNVCDVEKIQAIAEKYGLKVIYDAAHSFGVTYRGQGIGSYGDASIFSFHATKVFTTIEGGAVAVRDPGLGQTIRLLSNFGIADEDDVAATGTNAKMNEFEAAMGLCNLRHFEECRKAREQVFMQYMNALSGTRGIVIPTLSKDAVHNYSYFPIRVIEREYGQSRDELAGRMRQESIYPRRYFYPLTSDFDCYQGKYDSGLTPIARQAAREILTLPLYPGPEREQVERICSIIINRNNDIRRGSNGQIL